MLALHVAMEMPKLEEPARVRASDDSIRVWLEAARSGVLPRLEWTDLTTLLPSVDNAGWSALHYCAAKDHVSALQWLIKAGVPVGIKSSAGHTALAVAAHRGHADCLDYLIKAGSDVMALDRAKLTPLHHAAASANERSVRLLLQGGANHLKIEVMTNPQMSKPRTIAAQRARTANGGPLYAKASAVLKLLEEHLRLTHSWFRSSRYNFNGNVANITQMIEQMTAPGKPFEGVAVRDIVNMQNERGVTPLFDCRRPDVIDALLGFGADPNQPDSNGYSVLHRLVQNYFYAVQLYNSLHSDDRYLPSLNSLLAAGARPLVRLPTSANMPYNTPLELAEWTISDIANLCTTTGARASTAQLMLRARNSQFMARLRRADRHERLMRLWRIGARVTQVLMLAHARAVERVYAPGGIGFLEVERDFEERAAKSQRTE